MKGGYDYKKAARGKKRAKTRRLSELIKRLEPINTRRRTRRRQSRRR